MSMIEYQDFIIDRTRRGKDISKVPRKCMVLNSDLEKSGIKFISIQFLI